MRTFKGNATRDNSEGKIKYYGFRHPLVEHSFGKYMLKHQKCANGTMRDANNWWGGWGEDISIDSLTRHVADLEAIDAGFIVVKIRHLKFNEKLEPILDDDGVQETYEETMLVTNTNELDEQLPDNWSVVTKEDCYNAIKFNCNAGLLEYLKK